MFRPKQLISTLPPVDKQPDTAPPLNNIRLPLALSYEGALVDDLSQVGFKTIELLNLAASKNIINKTRFNVAALNTIALPLVLEHFKAQKIADNVFDVLGQRLKVEDNKWYNFSQKYGNINAVSLMKHLLAVQENINERDNTKPLFISACQHLTVLQDKVVSIVEPADTPAAIEDKPSPQKIDWHAINDQLNAIPLSAVMQYIGANANEDGQRGKWKMPGSGHNVHVLNDKIWTNWNTQSKGYGGISLLAEHIGYINNLSDSSEADKKSLRMMAIKELMAEFGNGYDLSAMASTMKIEYRELFYMPEIIDFKLGEVRDYLHQKRQLPLWIINKQIATGNLFAGFPSDWDDKQKHKLKDPEKLENQYVWAIFLAINGNAAEMRAIDRQDQYAKMLARGSDKEMGGFLIKAEKSCNEKTVVALEGAIDALSYHAFYPGRIVYSCMGTNFNLAVTSAMEILDSGYKFALEFDNDLAGYEASVRFRKSLISEIGEEEYADYRLNGKINFYDLGIRILIETIKNGDTFYLDAHDNDLGKEVVQVFQEELFKQVSKEEVRKLIAKGKIKYLNICPNFGLMKDPTFEARKARDLLESGKPYYLRIRSDKEEKPDIEQNRLAFESALKSIAPSQFLNWQQDGRLIYKKEPLAKDWNEFFIYMKNNPEFKARLAEQEQQFIAYNGQAVKKNIEMKL